MDADRARLYFEAHITVNEESDFERFLAVCREEGWRGSRFDQDEVDDYHGKWFMSARGTGLQDLRDNMKETLTHLMAEGFTVIRWKIEDTLLDSKHGDTL